MFTLYHAALLNEKGMMCCKKPKQFISFIFLIFAVRNTQGVLTMMTKIKLLMLIIFYLIISASAHAAGGIALGATRIIYPVDAKQTAVWIRNSHTNERFLVNSWIENSSGVKEKSFIITPPLFVSEPKSENNFAYYLHRSTAGSRS